MNKDEFLQMLQIREIREEILRIVKDEKKYILYAISNKEEADGVKSKKESAVSKSEGYASFKQEVGDNVEEKTLLENENNRLKEELIDMHSKLQQAQDLCVNAQNHIQRITGELQSSRDKIVKLSGELEEAQGKIQNFQTESDKWKTVYQAEKRNIDALRGRFQSEIDGLKQENQRLEQRKRSLEKANESLQLQMEQRFSKGWELFEAYQNVSAHTKQILHNGVFTQETNFISFICGGAQTSSLEKLWDALKECVMYGQQKDAQILWDIFEYCIELVNSSKTQAKYEVLPVNEGERFDSDIHTEGPNSLAQGKIVNVYLPGYQNTYNGKIIKKSIVQVG